MSAFVTRYLIWDTETTSGDVTKDDIISLGGVLCTYNPHGASDGKTKYGVFTKIDEFHCYVSTKKKIDQQAQAIHHITEDKLYNQPIFPEVIESFKTFLQQYQPERNARLVLVAHNGSKFDNIIMYANFVQHRMDFEDFLKSCKVYGFIDSLKFFKVLLKGCQYAEQPKDASTGRISLALGHCYKSFCKADLEGAHNALMDSRGLFDILNSDCISRKINLNNLFKSTTSKEKELKWIKSTVGVAFAAKEEQTRMEKLGNQMEIVKDDLSTDPIFEQESPQSNHKFCLNCMSFWKKDEKHEKCQITQALSKSGNEHYHH